MKIPGYRWSEHPRAFIVQIFLGLLTIVVVSFIYLLIASPKVSSTKIESQNDRATLLANVRVSFSLPISREEFAPKIEPNSEGTWRWEDPVLASRLYRTAVFEPSEPLLPNTTYKVELTGIKGLFSTKAVDNYSFEFTTQPIPEVKNIGVGMPHKITDPITIEFDYPVDKAVEYFYTVTPAVEFSVTTAENNLVHTLVPKTPLLQGTKYELTIEREIVDYDTALQRVIKRSERSLAFKKEFTTTDPLGVKKVEPQGIDILPTTKSVVVEFAENVIKDKALEFLSLVPVVSGTWQWKDSKTAEFIFTNQLNFDQKYTLNVLAGLPAENGSSIQNSSEFTFTTVGPLLVRSISPANRSTGITRSAVITIKFNQPADRSSVESSLSISPAINFSKSWKSDNTVVLTPEKELSLSTTYTVQLGTGAKSGFQKPLASTYISSFSTEEKVVILAVLLDKQDRALSCEVAALKMALVYKGISVTEDQLMSHIGYDPTSRSGGIWGDPDVAFVGDINGSQNTTGYGVHWDPIAKAANNYRKATAHTNLRLKDLTAAIDAGNPVVVWGTQGKAYYDPWTTPAGKLIPAWKGEHARTVIGYKGNSELPTAIITNDPIAGKVVWSASSFDANWARLSRAGVIVY